MQKKLETADEWDAWAGLAQRKIAQKAGISQSTVSDNKTFLVKSAKFLRETREGGLALVEGAEPSWWEKGDALDGFPKPEEVRAWWSSDPSPPGPEGTERTDHNVDGAETPHGEGVKGDREAADRGQDVADHPWDNHSSHCDREDDGDDRTAADQEFSLPNANGTHHGEEIGTIGGSGAHEEKPEAHDPKRIAELTDSLRRFLREEPWALRLDEGYDDSDIKRAARRMVWGIDWVTNSDFGRAEVEEAIRMLLKEDKVQKLISVPLRERG